MSGYKHLLLATDLSEAGRDVAFKAREMADNCSSKLSVVHVVEPVPVTSYVYAGAADMESQIEDEAQAELRRLCKEIGVAEADQYLEVGPPKMKILEMVDTLKADALIIGSHGHSGLSVLLGSTANAISHSAECDLLMVRIDEPE